jgi:hypothetical protein
MVFEYKEAILPQYRRHIPRGLNLSRSNSADIELKLIRLLSGTCTLKCNEPLKTIVQRRNYLDALNTVHTQVTSKTLKDCLAPFKLSDLESYLNNTRFSNHALLNDLLFEYSYYFLQVSRENHTSAFLHLYRILEYISYSFPLVHASVSKNFQGTFKNLQSYFTKDNGELGFLQKFISKLFDGDPIYSTTVDVNVNHSDIQIKKSIYKSYKKILPGDKVSFDDTRLQFSVEYADLISIIIMIRNRYFHFAIGGQRNIKSSEITYPDLFFKQINDNAFNWLSIIYFEVLKTLIDRWK